MRVKIFRAAGVAVAAAALTGAVLSAEEPRRPRRAGLDALQAEIGLSEEQVAGIQRIRIEERKDAIRRNAHMRVARMELEQLLDATTPDESAIAAKVKAISGLQAEALKARTESRLAIRRLVTPEQYQKMKQTRRHADRARRARPARRHWAPQGRQSGGVELQPDDPA